MAIKKPVFLSLAVGVMLLAGCHPAFKKYDYAITPTSAHEKAENYTITVAPLIANDKFTGFILNIENTSDAPVEIDWNKTLFIQGGQTNGGFIYEGIVYAERNNPRLPDVVLPHSAMNKEISPSNLVIYSAPYRYNGILIPGGWRKGTIGSGNHGVYVTIRCNQKEAWHKLVFDVSASDKLGG